MLCCQSDKETCHTTGRAYRRFIATAITVCSAYQKTLHTTQGQEIPRHRSVNTHYLFHTFSGLSTTLLLPSRLMCLNKHYHRPNKNLRRQAHTHTQKTAYMEKTGTKAETEIRAEWVHFPFLFRAPQCNLRLCTVQFELWVIWSSIFFPSGCY